jgi:hypothetical protein
VSCTSLRPFIASRLPFDLDCGLNWKLIGVAVSL